MITAQFIIYNDNFLFICRKVIIFIKFNIPGFNLS